MMSLEELEEKYGPEEAYTIYYNQLKSRYGNLDESQDESEDPSCDESGWRDDPSVSTDECYYRQMLQREDMEELRIAAALGEFHPPPPLKDQQIYTDFLERIKDDFLVFYGCRTEEREVDAQNSVSGQSEDNQTKSLMLGVSAGTDQRSLANEAKKAPSMNNGVEAPQDLIPASSTKGRAGEGESPKRRSAIVRKMELNDKTKSCCLLSAAKPVAVCATRTSDDPVAANRSRFVTRAPRRSESIRLITPLEDELGPRSSTCKQDAIVRGAVRANNGWARPPRLKLRLNGHKTSEA